MQNDAYHAILGEYDQELDLNVFTAQNTFPVEMKPLVANDEPRQMPVCLTTQPLLGSDCWFNQAEHVKVRAGLYFRFLLIFE